MTKLLKWFFYIVSLLIVLTIASAIFLVNYVNLNDFKAPISRKVEQLTGRRLIINGQLHWTFFPMLGISASGVSLSNAPGFSAADMINIKQADISIAVTPLFKGNIELGKLILNGMTLNLAKNARGVTNWQDLIQSKTNNATTESNSSDSKTFFKLAGLSLSGIQITNSSINWENAQANQTIHLNNLNLKAKNIALNSSFPVSFKTVVNSNKFTKPLNINLNTNVTINPSQQKINLNQLQLTMANLKVLGNLLIQSLSTSPTANGNFTIPAFDLNQTLTDFGKPINSPGLNNASAKFQLHANKNNIAIDQLQAQIFQGTLTGHVDANLSGNMPRYSVNTAISNVPVQLLLASFAQNTHLNMTGNTNVDANLSMAGATASAIKKNLNGNIKFNIQNGLLHGIDIAYYSALADSIVNKTSPTKSNTDQTAFSRMSGSFQINNGVAQTNDLVMQTSLAAVTGKGSANLVSEQLNYELSLQRLTNGSTIQPRGPAIPISVTGPFAKPVIQPNWTVLATSIIKSQLQDAAGKQIQKVLGNSQLGQQIQQGLGSLLGN